MDVPVSLSHEVGALGLLERENATVLNAALHRVARDVTGALVTVVEEEGLDAAPYFAQNDGTLMELDYAARYPVLSIGSGPANSIRGAARLSGADDAIIVDVGGTTSDLGVLAGAHRRARLTGRELVLRGAPTRVARLLRVARLDRVITVEPPSRLTPA